MGTMMQKISMEPLDRFDIAILAALQRDARVSSVALAEEVHLSASQVARRMRRLEQSGAIRSYTTVLDPKALGLNVMAFTSISLDVQTSATTQGFRDAIGLLPQVLECFATTGDDDFLLKIMTTDLQAFSDLLMTEIMPLPHVSKVRSSIVLTEFKNDTKLAMDHLV